MIRNLVSVSCLLVLVVLLSSCGRQPAQSYVVTGTLELPPREAQQFNELLRNNVGFDLVMTARSSPQSKDILIQRRWEHLQMPFEFGLGKGRADAILRKTKALYITAHLECRNQRFKINHCGFTAKPVPVGTHHINIVLDSNPDDDATYRKPGAPVGGWSSASVLEEAAPPGREQKPLGAIAFQGEIVVPSQMNRALKDWKLRIIARERADRGFPELILPIDSPEFPLSFSLHQNHRMTGGTDPVLDPKYVVVILDKDGMVESTNDQVIVTTSEQVAIGTRDLEFKLPASELQRLMEGKDNAQSRPSSAPANPRPTGKTGMLVAEGTIDLPTKDAAAAEGATLWLSVRDAKSNASLMFKREANFSFPYKFSIRNGDGDMGMTVKEGANIVVRVILTKTGDPLDKTAFVGVSDAVTTGAKGLKVTLAKQ